LGPGQVYVALTDCHLLVEPGRLCLNSGTKEDHFRPAIDPLLRAAALAYGPRVIGVARSGGQHGGSAGLLAIKDRGGLDYSKLTSQRNKRS
jgi:two-component system chemotaxis response regulator CheB